MNTRQKIFAVKILMITSVMSCCVKKINVKPCENRGAIPNYKNLVKSILYYKLNDNCNFQTLAFQSCFADETDYNEKIPSENHNSYTVLGRFNGNAVNDSLYRIDSLEVKHFFLDKDDTINNIAVSNCKIGRVQLSENSKVNDVQIVFDIIKDDKPTPENELDYIYGRKKGEKPIIIHRDATISFFVRDSTNHRILEFMGCTDISPESAGIGFSGGYECNGKPTFPPGP